VSELNPESNFIIAHMLDERPVEFTEWPRHMTLVSWFQSREPEILMRSLKELADFTEPIQARVEQWDDFGPNADIPVQRIARTPELAQLHESLVDVVQGVGKVLSLQYARDAYKPHITKQNEDVFREGQLLVMHDFSLIAAEGGKKAREHRAKKIIGTFALLG
jgi:hypothetical protein